MTAAESGIIGEGRCLVTTIHVRYEILDDPGRPHLDLAPDSFAWGVQAVGLPGNLWGTSAPSGSAIRSPRRSMILARASGGCSAPGGPRGANEEIAVTVDNAA